MDNFKKLDSYLSPTLVNMGNIHLCSNMDKTCSGMDI